MEMSLAQKAINAALQGNWGEAIKFNLEILDITPNDIDSLNRLAKAYAESGKFDLAKKTAQKVLTIDPTNTIAQRCFDKWKVAKNGEVKSKEIVSPESFLEDPGKTKLVSLMNPGDNQVLAGLDSGDRVKLLPHPHSIAIVTQDNKNIGKLPDDLAARLKNLIKSGNKYDVIVKSVEAKQVTVFIREIERSQKVAGVQSFPTEKIEYVSFTPPELVHKDTPIMDTGEEEQAEEIS
jgi:tetratricopeptide (TPR) repeat protein